MKNRKASVPMSYFYYIQGTRVTIFYLLLHRCSQLGAALHLASAQPATACSHDGRQRCGTGRAEARALQPAQMSRGVCACARVCTRGRARWRAREKVTLDRTRRGGVVAIKEAKSETVSLGALLLAAVPRARRRARRGVRGGVAPARRARRRAQRA